jgi:hypothetical protein
MKSDRIFPDGVLSKDRVSKLILECEDDYASAVRQLIQQNRIRFVTSGGVPSDGELSPEGIAITSEAFIVDFRKVSWPDLQAFLRRTCPEVINPTKRWLGRIFYALMAVIMVIAVLHSYHSP